MNLEEFNSQVETLKEKTKPQLFDFTDYSDFLNAYVNAYGKYSHGPYNLKNWAQRLGYKSPSSLAMILNKNRFPTYKMIMSLSEDFGFTQSEKRYFEILVQLEKNKKDGKDVMDLLKEANKISGKNEYQQISYEQFALISDWYCYAVKALIANNNFVNDLDWMHRALRRKVSPAQIKSAIYNLKSVGLIEDCPVRGLREATEKTQTGNTLPSAAIRNHHRGMLFQASQSLDEQEIDNRLFQGLTMNFSKEGQREEAFRDIMNFVKDFNNKYRNDEEGDSVYQLNLQFFELTNNVEHDG